MYCSKCGTELPENAGFCFKCGSSVGQARTDVRVAQLLPERTVGVVRTRKGELTITSQRLKWSDGSSLRFENIERTGVTNYKKRWGADDWKLDVWRTDGMNEPTMFLSELDAGRAQQMIEQALNEFRVNPLVRPATEYKDIRVALNIEGSSSAGSGITQDYAVRNAAIQAAGAANVRITAAIRDQAEHGWHPEGPTDLLGLLLAGRVQWHQSGGMILTWRFTFDHAVIQYTRENR